MEIVTKARVEILLVMIAASTALFAQSRGPGKPGSDASVLDAHQIVELSIAATERSWLAREHYTYMERDEARRLDSLGVVKSQNIDVTRMMLVNGARFEKVMEHNGQPVSATEARKDEENLEKLKHETPEAKALRFHEDLEKRSYLRELPEAFDFHLLGEENVGGRPAYVFVATPHPGYHTHGRYGKLFTKVAGKVWVDKQDFGWIKVDGEVTQSFSMGLFVARVQQGSHIILEQTSVGNAVWVPKRLEMQAKAKILFLKSLGIERILTYSEYFPATGGSYVVSR